MTAQIPGDVEDTLHGNHYLAEVVRVLAFGFEIKQGISLLGAHGLTGANPVPLNHALILRNEKGRQKFMAKKFSYTHNGITIDCWEKSFKVVGINNCRGFFYVGEVMTKARAREYCNRLAAVQTTNDSAVEHLEMENRNLRDTIQDLEAQVLKLEFELQEVATWVK